MARQQFRSTNFREDSLLKISQMNQILAAFRKVGVYKLTARQLYYQFVGKDWIPNTPRSYKNLTKLLADARYAGMVDWDAIEDRVREPTIWSEYRTITDATKRAIENFRLPRWKGQPRYVELWVEKEALAGILEPLAADYHAVLLVNKGYSSASALYDSARRFIRRADLYGGDPLLFYVGDHDPSGEDMVRDLGDRLAEFGSPLEIQKLALTMAQVEEFELPPNPAKTTDSRYEKYAEEHGTESWEVDALPPDELQKIIREAFDDVIDRELMEEYIEKEDTAREKLSKAMKKIDKDLDNDEEDDE